MAVTVETLIGIITVAFLWGVTNPLMKKGAHGINSIQSSNAINQFFKDIYFLITNLKYIIPFLINQSGSLLYIFVLQHADLSLVVIVVNSLTFTITALTGIFLGEEKIHQNTLIGVLLVLVGTSLCCIDKVNTLT